MVKLWQSYDPQSRRIVKVFFHPIKKENGVDRTLLINCRNGVNSDFQAEGELNKLLIVFLIH